MNRKIAAVTAMGLIGISGVGASTAIATAQSDNQAQHTPKGDVKKDGANNHRHGALAKDLAKSLGVEETKVQAALDKIHGERKAEREKAQAESEATLAKKLGVSEEKLKEAFTKDSNGKGDKGFRSHRAHSDLSQVAKKLGVNEDKLRDALEENRPKFDKNSLPKKGDFAEKLAKELGVDFAKVEKALGDSRGGERGPVRHGDHGPGEKAPFGDRVPGGDRFPGGK